MKKSVIFLIMLLLLSSLVFSASKENSEKIAYNDYYSAYSFCDKGKCLGNKPVIDKEITRKLKKESFVPVFIILRQQGVSETAKVGYDELLSRENIKSAQKRLLSRLNFVKKGETKKYSKDDVDLILKFQYELTYAIAGEITKRGLDKLKNDPDVLIVQLDDVAYPALDDSAKIVKADKVWRDYSVTGEGETVCVVDTGVNYTHPALGGCTRSDFLGGKCNKVIAGYDFGDSDSDPMDDHLSDSSLHGFRHGTHVAGIVASGDATYKGVAHGAKIAAVKVYQGGSSRAFTSDIASGIEWCINHKKDYNISVISMSIGDGKSHSDIKECESVSVAVTDLVNRAVNENMMVVAAAGNEGFTNGINWPACIRNAVSVGATVDDSTIIYNRNKLLDVLAPGVGITSTDGSSNSFVSMSGTSMATPHVSGAIALIREYLKKKNIKATPESIRTALRNTGKKIYDSDTKLYFSLIDIYSAIKYDYLSFCDTASCLSDDAACLLRADERRFMCGNRQYYQVRTSQTCTVSWIMTPSPDADYDLFVKWDGSKASLGNWDCRPFSTRGVIEICQKTLPPGTYYAMVNKVVAPENSRVYVIEALVTNCRSEGGGLTINTDFNMESANLYLSLGSGKSLQEAVANQKNYESSQLPVSLSIQSGDMVCWGGNSRSSDHVFDDWTLTDDDGKSIYETDSNSFCVAVSGSGNILASGSWRYTPNYYTISGRVLKKDNSPLEGVDIEISNFPGVNVVKTGSDGRYVFSNIPGGTSYKITPNKAGYSCMPPSISYPNLIKDLVQDFVCYTSDHNAPRTEIISSPEGRIDYTSVKIKWVASDDVTPVGSLVYSYKLEGYDADWSDWVSASEKTYELSNGDYTFLVKAKDSSGNVEATPEQVSFIVNANPKIEDFADSTGIWTSKVKVKADASCSSCYVILSEEDALSSDKGLVPVEVHKENDKSVLGASEYVAERLGVPVLLEKKARNGFKFIIPDSMKAGETRTYEIVWGKVAYMNWKEEEKTTPELKNPVLQKFCKLDSNKRTWCFLKRLERNDPGWVFDEEFWIDFSVTNPDGTSFIPQTEIAYYQGVLAGVSPDGRRWGEVVEPWVFWGGIGSVIESEGKIWLIWQENKFIISQDFKQSYYNRYVYKIYNSDGSVYKETTYGDWQEKFSFASPRKDSNERVWLVLEPGSGHNSLKDLNEMYFYILNPNGDIYKDKTLFASIPAKTWVDFNQLVTADDKMWLFYKQEHEVNIADHNYFKSDIFFQIYNLDGTRYLGENQITNPSDTNPFHETSDITGDFMSDSDGKVWLGYLAWKGSVRECYYEVRKLDGSLYTKVNTGNVCNTGFRTLDYDNLLWALIGDQRVIFRADATEFVGRKPVLDFPALKLNGKMFSYDVNGNYYKEYNRWSPTELVVTAEGDDYIGNMYLYDIDLWKKSYHAKDLVVKDDFDTIFSGAGEFDKASVDVKKYFSAGENVLTLDQSSFDGGQVLVYFEYQVPTTGFVRGNVNGGQIDISDAVFILNYMFSSGEEPKCLDSADVDDDGQLTIGDAIYLLNYLFAQGPEPKEPFPDAGVDPTEDDLNC